MKQTIQLRITGMTCDHCVHAVTRALRDVPGVVDAKVSLKSNSAAVEGEDLDVARVIAAIQEEGYDAAVV